MDFSILNDIVLLLAACLILGGAMSRLGQSPIVGYLLAGMFLGGPGSFHVIHSGSEIEAISELGVALLLFSLGLEFSVTRLKKLGVMSLIGGILQIVLTIVLTGIFAFLLGFQVKEAIAFGIMLSLSSTAVVLRIIMERAELDMQFGRNSLAVLLVQDMAVVPLALLMTILGNSGPINEILLSLGKLVALAAGLIIGLVIINQTAVRVLGTLTLSRNRELTMIFAVVMGLGAAGLSHQAGISPALGAFVAGMLLGSSEFATQVRADISPLRVVLLTLFFGAAGMVADPIWILNNLHIVGGVTCLLIVGKLLIVWVIFRILGSTIRIAAATGLCLAQIGEFAFVLGGIGKASGVVSESQYALIVSVSIMTLFLSAFTVPYATHFGNICAKLFGYGVSEIEVPEEKLPPPDVVVIGFGPSAQIAVRPLVDQSLHVLVIDLNRKGVAKAKELGFYGEVGDAMQDEVLEHARIRLSKVVVITIPSHGAALAILEKVRRDAPFAHVIVRSRHQIDEEDLLHLGAIVVGDEEEVGKALAVKLRDFLATIF